MLNDLVWSGTFSNIISGDVSAGIEPIIANAYVDKTAKGTFIRKNSILMVVLDGHNKNTDKFVPS